MALICLGVVVCKAKGYLSESFSHCMDQSFSCSVAWGTLEVGHKDAN